MALSLPPPGFQPLPAEPGMASSPLLAALHQALRQPAAGRVALRVGAGAEHRRRMARALMQEAAQAGGGRVLDGPQDDLVLLGGDAATASRLCPSLERLLGGRRAGAITLWALDRDVDALLAYCAGSGPGFADPALLAGGGGGAPPEGLAQLDAWLAALPLAGVMRRHAGLRLDPLLPGAAPAPESHASNTPASNTPASNTPATPGARQSHQRLGVSGWALRGLMGPLGADPELVGHARRILARRALEALADPAQRRALLGDAPPGLPLHLDMPPTRMADPEAPPPAADGSAPRMPAEPMLVALVPLAEAARPAALAQHRAALARHGWAMALDRISAGVLRLVDPAALPADLLRLRWSPALEAPDLAPVLRALDPARLVLTGCDRPGALAWGRGRGITRFEGPQIEALMAPSPAPLPLARAGRA